MRNFIWSAVLLSLALMLLAACGSSGSSTATPTIQPSGSQQAAVPATNPATVTVASVSSTRSPVPTRQTESASPTPFVSDWSIGLGGWTATKDWTVVEGQLLNDASNNNPDNQALAPFFPATRNYAVDTQIQFVNWDRYSGASWGVLVRGYFIGVCAECVGSNSSGIFIAYDSNVTYSHVIDAPYTPDGNWHTLRVVMQANTIQVMLDGQEVLKGTDNRHLDPGRVGLWSANSQVTVRSVSIQQSD